MGADQLAPRRQNTGLFWVGVPFFAGMICQPPTISVPAASRAAVTALPPTEVASFGKSSATYVDVAPCRTHAVGAFAPSRPNTIVPSGSIPSPCPAPRVRMPKASS